MASDSQPSPGDTRNPVDALTELSRAVAAEADPAHALWLLVSSVREQLGIDRAGIFAYDRDSEALRLVTGVDRSGRAEFSTQTKAMDGSHTPLLEVARREMPFYYSDDAPRDYPAVVWAPGVRAHAIVPIVAGNMLLGALAVDNCLTGRTFGESLIDPLFLYAALAALPLFSLYQQREQERSEALRVHLTREVLFAVTEGRFQVCSREEMEGEWPGRGASGVAVRGEADVRSVREAVRAAGEAAGMTEERAADLALCASEAATNALLHGGGGMARVGARGGRVRVRVDDQGEGIDPQDLPRATLLKGWSKRASMGLGFTIINETADRVYLYTGPRGTTILIEMSVEEAPLPDSANPLLWGEPLAV